MKQAQFDRVILVLKFLNETKRVYTARHLNTICDFGSTEYLSRVLSRLSRLGVIRSVKGPGGGYSNTFSSIKLTYLDVSKCLGHRNASDPLYAKLYNVRIEL